MAARGYRAGTAYVEVLPVMGRSQQYISDQFRRALNDKQTLKGMREAIRQEIVAGAKDASEETRQHLEKHADGMAKNIADDIRENGKLSIKQIDQQKVASEKAARESAGAWRTEMLKATKEIDKSLGDLGKGRDARGRSVFGDHLTEARKQINSIMDAIDGRTKMSDANLRRTYQSLSSIVRRMGELQPGKNVAGDSDMFDVTKAVESIDKYFDAVERHMTPKQVAEEKRRAKAAEDAIKAENDAREAATKQAIKDEKARQDQIKKERDEAYAADTARLAKREAQRQKYLENLAKAEDIWEEERIAKIRDNERRAQAERDRADAKYQKKLDKRARARQKYLEDLRKAEDLEAKAEFTAAAARARRQEAAEDRAAERQRIADKKADEADRQRIAAQAERDRQDIARRRKFLADTRAVNDQHRRLSADDMASYDDVMRTRMDQTPKLGQERVGNNRRQEAAIGRLRRETHRLQGEIQSTISALTALNAARPAVTLSTGRAESDLRHLQSSLAFFAGEEFTASIGAELKKGSVESAKAKLKAQVSQIDEDVELDIEVEDEEARAKIIALRTYLQQLKQDDYSVLVDIDERGLDAIRGEVKRLTSEVHELNLTAPTDEARASIQRLDQAIDAIDGKTVGVDITEQRARANIAIIRQELERLDRMDVDVHIDVEYRRNALNQLKQFEQQMERGGERVRSLNQAVKNAGISLTETTQAFRIFNPVLAGVAAAGAPVVSALGGIVAGAGALVSVIPGAVGGLSALGFAFGGLGDAVTKYRKAQAALETAEKERTQAQKNAIADWEGMREAVGKNTIEFIEYTEALQEGVAKIQGATREAMFPGLQRGLEAVMSYEEPFTDFMGTMGEMLGNVGERWGEALASTSAGNWFSRVAEDAQLYTPGILMAVENIVGGFASLTDAFRPFAREFVSWLINSTGRFESWAAALSGMDKFTGFLDSARSTLPGVGDALKGIGELFVSLTIALEPFTTAILDATNSALDFINAMDPGDLSAILGAVGGLVGGLMLLTGVMAGVGAVAAVIQASTGTLLTTVASGLALFVATSSAALGASVALEGGVDGLWGSALGLVDSLDEVQSIAGTVVGIMGDLFDALSPLLPAVFDLTEMLIGLTGSGLEVLAEVVEVVAVPLGWLVDLFTALPTEVQGTILALAILLPNLDKVRGAFDSAWLYGSYFFEGLAGGSGNLKRNVLGILGTLGETILGVGETLIDGATHMGTFGTKAKAASGNLSTMNTRLLGLAGGVVGIAAITGAMMIYNDAQERANDRVELFDAKMKGLDTTVLNSAQGIAEMRAALDELFTADNALWNDIEGLDNAMQRLGNDKWWMPITMMNNAFAGLGETMEGADESLLALIEGGNIEGAVLMYDEMAAAAARNDIAHKDLNEELPDFVKKLQTINAELGGVVDEEVLLAELREGRIPEALVKAIEASDEYGGAINDVTGDLDEAEQATRDLIDATDEMTGRNLTQAEAQTRYGEAMREFKEKLAEAKHGMDEFTETGAANRRMFENLARETRNKADADLEATGNAAAYAETLWDSRDAMAAHMEDLGLTEDQALDLANAYLEIPDWVETEADLITYASNMAETDDILEQMGKIDGYDAHPSVMLDDEASPDIRGVEGKLDDLDGEVANPKANLDDNVTGQLKLPQNKLDELQDTYVATIKVTADDPYGILFKKGPGKSPGPWADGLIPHANGGILEHFAKGGLKPMDPVAQMVKPNTWRVVGDRMKDDEAYIPLDGSSRSKSILFEAIERMPGLFMEKGGLLKAFATGGVASPAAGGEKAPEGEGGELAKVSDAFAALDAALRSGFTSLLADLLGMSQEFFASLMAAHLGFNEESLAASALYRQTETGAEAAWQALTLEAQSAQQAAELGAEQAHSATLATLWGAHRSKEAAAKAEHRANDLAAASTYFADLRDLGATYRFAELTDMQGFHNENARMITSFGSGAHDEWTRIWRDLRDSTKSIFGDVPGDVGGILVDVSKKLNEHIVSPFNKIIKDLDLKKIDPLSEFPTQSYATGGHVKLATGGFMPGYTPGRDVHTFVSPTGGVLELSGGEPVLRPEAGKVLGRGWVDGVNMAARTGGVRGVQKFLGAGGQAFSTGGVWNNLWGIIHEQFPGARLTSAKRNGTGGSYHNTGRAIDIAGPERMDKAYMMRMFNFIHDNYGNSAEVIYTPATGRNILNGRYHEYSPAVKADHHDHVHWANRVRFSGVNGPPTGESAMGLYDIAGNMESWISNARKAIDDGFMQSTAMESYAGLFSEVAKQKQDAFITDHSHLATDPGGPGGGVARWRPMVNAALDHVGQSTSEAMQNIVLRRMNQESGGNPRAINLWDSNARRGTPSKGLMQVIDPTFRAYRDRSLINDIWDPMANIVASMRYALGRYGSLPAAYNRKGGYALGTAGIDLADLFGDSGAGSPLPGGIQPLLRDRGGAVPTGYSVVQNNTGHEETILPATPREVERLLAGGLGGPQIDNSVTFDNVRFEGDPEQMYETAMRRQRVAAIQRPMKF